MKSEGRPRVLDAEIEESERVFCSRMILLRKYSSPFREPEAQVEERVGDSLRDQRIKSKRVFGR